MFSKKAHIDVKKSTSKIQDAKKDLATRLKHLKNILENIDTAELKGLFEANFSHVYNILYDSFIQAETNLRQRELSFHLVHKAHKEELECSLWVLENVLALLPELLHKRWQIHSLRRILSKLLHPGNNIKLRKQAIKYFLMWYQALEDNAPQYIHDMFASLVPNLTPSIVPPTEQSSSVFHDTNMQNPVSPGEILPLLPPSGGERPPEHSSQLFLETLLQHMVTTVIRLEWHDKASRQHRSFQFLLQQFKTYYLPIICPSFCYDTSLYKPILDLPTLRKPEADGEHVSCRVILIKWITQYMHYSIRKLPENPIPSTSTPSISNQDEELSQHESSHHSLDSSMSVQVQKPNINDEELANTIVREVLCSSRENVNFVHEMYRQAFLLNFTHSSAVHRVIALYKDLIQINIPEIPTYLLEPPDGSINLQDEFADGVRPGRLRNDSYIGAVHKENIMVRAGMQNMLQLFMTHAANVFLQEISSHVPSLLEEQTDSCKRVLNIYRYMVMHTHMDNTTWEQLLLVLLQITSLVLPETPPKKKQQTLGGKLAPAIFQTLIVTWIKANLNVSVSRNLWDRFLNVLSDLTHWDELIKEWAKTMETLTRVLARHVYNLDLTDLPLDRLSEQKTKRTRRGTSRTDLNPIQVPQDTPTASNKQDLPHVPDGRTVSFPNRLTLTRSLSETSLQVRPVERIPQRQRSLRMRRSRSLGTIAMQDNESTDRTRSPSPAPSSGLESTSIKDSPIQLDVLADTSNVQDNDKGENRGIVCGGTVRGWLPDVAVILWRRMLSALGDVNQISEPRLHAEVFEYLVHLTDTLIKIKQNQGITGDNQSTPEPPELVPPVTLIVPWCFEALLLPQEYQLGRLSALRLLCTITLHCDVHNRPFLPQFYRTLHAGLCGTDRAALNVILQHLGPRFLSLNLPGYSLLLLDLVHACHSVLSSSDTNIAAPRTHAVSTLANLLSLATGDLSAISVLQPEVGQLHVMSCPDLKEMVVGILLRAGRYEPTGVARCIALCALGMFVYRELSNETFHPKIKDAINILLLALRFNHKVVAQVSSDVLLLLCEHADVLHAHYPRLAARVLWALGHTLTSLAPLRSTASDRDRALGTTLLLCLGEWCMRLGPKRLLELEEHNATGQGSCLLLTVFKVLNQLVTGNTTSDPGLTQPNMQEDFDPIILVDNLDKPSPVVSPTRSQQYQHAVTLCARTVLSHLVTHLGHFPLAIGAARLSSLVVENDDVSNLMSDELSSTIFSAANIQLLMLTSSVVTSLIELPTLELPGGGVTAGLTTADKQVRVLLRDQSGKACWDASILYKPPMVGALRVNDSWNPPLHNAPESMLMSTAQPHLPQHAIRHRPPNQLPEITNAAPDLDQLDDLLQYLGYTSPECLESSDAHLNEPAASPISDDLEQEAIGAVISQRNSESEYLMYVRNTPSMIGYHATPPEAPAQRAPFQYCRLLFSQLGLAGWDHRKQLYLLQKTERLLRELRNLDTQRCRETHKVAVVYIGPGQEDKNSILSNNAGSPAYEKFLAGLAWEVELESHTGFMGGLHRQGSTGDTAPYYATSFLEIIFHVATRMPGETPEAVLNKTRHLGNDEVHIVWSEHSRDYRRDIIPTEFCDILITIYPLGNCLNRITVNCKPDVPYFGPLFDEAIVENSVLPGLVRATVISASRAKRTTLPFFQQYYEERCRSLDTIVDKHMDRTTYEEFISQVFSPVMGAGPFCVRNSSGPNTTTTCSTATFTPLTAALLDHNAAGQHSHSHKAIRVTDSARAVWFTSNDSTQTIESTSISPRPLKKLSNNLKSVPRRSIRQEHNVESPPSSPMQAVRRK